LAESWAAAKQEGKMKSLDAFDWAHVGAELDIQGHATLRGLLAESECKALAEGARDTNAQADTIDLESIKQGCGELRRFRSGLPEELAVLRASLYERLVGTANRWQEGLSEKRRYPESFSALSARGTREHPLFSLSRLRTGEHWGLHKDLEGEHAFPLQVSALLSQPGRDFSGGELVMTEQRPRMQSRPIVVVPKQGDVIILAADGRPFRGTKGFYRVSLKHAVSRVRSGERVSLEMLFDGAA
jgi:hypothetical protein